MTTGDLWMGLWALLVALSCLQITIWGSSMAVSDLLTMGFFLMTLSNILLSGLLLRTPRASDLPFRASE